MSTDTRTKVDVAIVVDALSKTFGGVQALREVSLSVPSGGFFGVIGPNGSGKTTMLNVLSGALVPSGGTIQVLGTELGAIAGRPHSIAELGVHRTFQNIRLLPGRSVLENVVFGSYLQGSSTIAEVLFGVGRARREARSRAEEARRLLDELSLSDHVGTQAESLPYGLQRRVEMARAMMGDPSILLLDEPTAGMTPGETDELFRYFRAKTVAGLTVVVIEHDVAAMVAYATSLAVLHHGQLLCVGDAAEVIKRDDVVEAYIGRSTRS